MGVASRENTIEPVVDREQAVDVWSLVEAEPVPAPLVDDRTTSVGSGVGPATQASWSDFPASETGAGPSVLD